MNNLAPIVLFVYNRYRHTLKTLEALSENILSKDSKLYIYADGPKADSTEVQIKNIKLVRDIIRKKRWCGEVEIIERNSNLGLAQSVIAGVSEIVSKYGRAIVLEDDIITSPHFLQYMNNALNVYCNTDKVKSISGYMLPVKGRLPESFFLKFESSWGWATWKRAWDEFIHDPSLLINHIHNRGLVAEFNFDNSYDFYKMLLNQKNKKIDSWAIRWYASIFLSNGLTLFPSISYIRNIGNDNSGVHSGKTNRFHISKLNINTINMYPSEINENISARHEVCLFFKNLHNPTLTEKILFKLLNTFPK